MKILLLNLPSLPGTTTDRRLRCTVKSPRHLLHPPLGLAYISAALRAWNNIEARIIDAAIENCSICDLLTRAKALSPNLIVAPVGSYSFRWDLAVLKQLKEAVSVPIAVFGEYPTVLAENILLGNGQIDFCVLGESETAVSQLTDYLQGKRALAKVNGLAYRREGQVCKNPSEVIEALDTIPYPDRQMLNNEKYHCIPFVTQPYTDLITSRGCPFRCKFCTTQAYWGRKHRKRSPANILGEVEECGARFGIKSFFIPDETFTVDRGWVSELDHGFKKLKVNWALQTRVDLVTEELLHAMADSGCVYIHYGAESGSQKILDYYDKGITVEQIRNAFGWTKDAGIEVNASFIIGCPEETPQTVDETIRLAVELKADYVHFSPLIPSPLSPFYREFKDKGLLLHERFEEYVKPNIVFKPKYMRPEDIHRSIKKAYRATIMNPQYISRYIMKIFKKGGWAEFKRMFIAAKWVVDSFFKEGKR